MKRPLLHTHQVKFFVPFSALLILLTASSTLAAASTGDDDTVCIESVERTKNVENTKANWDGEVLSVRYFNHAEDHDLDLKLIYTSGSKRYEAQENYRGFISPSRNSWSTVRFSLPRAPSTYTLVRTFSECTKTRPKTFLEKLEDMADKL